MDDGSLFVYPGLSPSHFRFIVALLARSARVPIGFEVVAQEPETYDGNLARVPVDDRTPLVGLTLGRALNALVAADPRYAWREQDRDADHSSRRSMARRDELSERERRHNWRKAATRHRYRERPIRFERAATYLVVRRRDRQPNTDQKWSSSAHHVRRPVRRSSADRLPRILSESALSRGNSCESHVIPFRKYPYR